MENKADDPDLMEFTVRWGRQTSKGAAIASVLSAALVRRGCVHVSLGGCFLLVHLMTEHKYPPLASTSFSNSQPFSLFFSLSLFVNSLLSCGPLLWIRDHKHRDTSLFIICVSPVPSPMPGS